LRRWIFDISLRTPAIHLIRDHITLLTDLGKDWSAGPPSHFDRWIPMQYVINVSLQDFEVNLYLDDHNIITHPHARESNSECLCRSLDQADFLYLSTSDNARQQGTKYGRDAIDCISTAVDQNSLLHGGPGCQIEFDITEVEYALHLCFIAYHRFWLHRGFPSQCLVHVLFQYASPVY
jgi:BLTP1 N-terminal region